MREADHLYCNNRFNPLGVDSPVPLLGWRADHQAAYRLRAAVSAAALEQDSLLVWDSGKVVTDECQNILWNGGPLASGIRYHWQVKTWSETGEEAPWSEMSWFETGLLEPSDWCAKWIHALNPAEQEMKTSPAPYFRKSFILKGTPDWARIYICGLGYFELSVNGQKIGYRVLEPSFTVFDRKCLYSTFDVTSCLSEGENVIGVILGSGMYDQTFKNAWDFEKAPWRDNPKLLLQADFRFADGSEASVLSSSDWKTAAGPIVNNNLYAGEVYDARLEMPGWDKPGFDDSGWIRARVCRAPGGQLASMQMDSISVVEEFKPIAVWEAKPDVWVYDMGRNISGWSRLRVKGPAGTTITLKHTELRTDSGDVDDSNIRYLVDSPEFQCDTYILKGDGVETWQPRFTYHGFQYVRLTGFPGVPGLDDLTGCVVHTDLAKTGGFTCSNDLLNKIQAAARASSLYNYHGMPTDCPHREKNGWTGDALLSAEQMLLNFKAVNAYKKWLGDIMDCQRPSGQLPGIAPTGGWGYNWGSGPAWDSIVVFLPWHIYLYTGDKSCLKDCWPAITRYIGFMDSMSEDATVDFGLGDWCPPEGGPEGAKTPTRVSDTWFYYADTHLAGKIANALGMPGEAAFYKAKAEGIRQAFHRCFIDEESGDVAGSCQTSYAIALQFGLTEGRLAGKIFSRLVDEVERCGRHIDCGTLGACYALKALTDGGRPDLAYAIAAQRTFPGWGHWIVRGATTLWEMWDGAGSRNHHMFSSISAFFYNVLAGINPDETAPGFRRILFKPNPVPGLDKAEAWHDSPYGMIRLSWETSGARWKCLAEVPSGTTAVLHVPAGYQRVRVGGSDYGAAGTVNLPSGIYSITAE